MNTELAWAAGFIDGEGSFNWNITKDDYGVPRFNISQVRPEPLDRVHALFPFLGRSAVKARYGNQPQECLWANGVERVQQLVASLWPYLSEPKREDARRVLLRARAQRAAR